MMRKLPDCPSCQENELWLQYMSFGVYIRCYYCGWTGKMIPAPSQADLDAAIATVVEAAQAPVSAPIAQDNIS